MDMEEFHRICQRWTRPFASNHFNDSFYFHVVLHLSALESFCLLLEKDTIYVSNISGVRKDHVHLLVQTKENHWRKRWGSRWDELENRTQYRLILKYWIQSSTEHDTLCHAQFGIPSLKDMTLDCILHNLPHIKEATTHLHLPTSLKQTLYQRCESQCNLFLKFPDYNSELLATFKRSFKTLDPLFDRKKIAWLFSQPPFFPWSRNVIAVAFQQTDGTIVRKCGHCIRENALRRIQQYLTTDERWRDEFIKDPMNWCHVCKQVPLFQILTYRRMSELYELHSYIGIITAAKDTSTPLLVADPIAYPFTF